jgi:hypothetical protein
MQTTKLHRQLLCLWAAILGPRAPGWPAAQAGDDSVFLLETQYISTGSLTMAQECFRYLYIEITHLVCILIDVKIDVNIGKCRIYKQLYSNETKNQRYRRVAAS